MKARGAAMSKGALAEALATQVDVKKSVCGKLIGSLAEIGANEVKKSVCGKLIGSLAEIGANEVKKAGIFTLPGLCRIKTRVKPATKAGKKMMFGKEVVVKAKPAKTVVKAFAVAALKRSI